MTKAFNELSALIRYLRGTIGLKYHAICDLLETGWYEEYKSRNYYIKIKIIKFNKKIILEVLEDENPAETIDENNLTKCYHVFENQQGIYQVRGRSNGKTLDEVLKHEWL